MRGRTARQEATHAMRLTPLKESSEPCGQRLGVGSHGSRTVTRLDGLWKLTIVVRRCIQEDVPTLPRGLSTRGRRALGLPAWRIWLRGDCLDWPLAYTLPPLGPRDAPSSAFTWGEHHATQCDLFNAAL